MIARAKLEVILGVLAPRLAGGAIEPIDPDVDPAPLTSITVERIAVVSVIGTLVSRSGYLDAASGLAVLRRHRRRDCRRDGTIRRVRGVILDVDSPGGEVGGLFDLVEQIGAIKAGTRQAALGGGERKRTVGGLRDREHSRSALRDADRRGRLDRRGRGSCRRERRRREGRARVDLRVRRRAARSTATPMSRSPQRARATIQADVDRLYARVLRAGRRQSRPDQRGRARNERRDLSRRARDPRRSRRPPRHARSRDCRDGRRARPRGIACAQHHQPNTEEEPVHGDERNRTGIRDEPQRSQRRPRRSPSAAPEAGTSAHPGAGAEPRPSLWPSPTRPDELRAEFAEIAARRRAGRPAWRHGRCGGRHAQGRLG